MTTGGERRQRRGLTPEQRAEKFSTEGLGFEESLRRVLAGGPDDEHAEREAEGMNDQEQETRPLSDQEWRERLERERARNADPNYHNPLVPPPDYVRQAVKRSGGDP